MKQFLIFFLILFINVSTIASEAYFDLSEKEIQIQTDFNGKEIIIFGIFQPRENTIVSIIGPKKDTNNTIRNIKKDICKLPLTHRQQQVLVHKQN